MLNILPGDDTFSRYYWTAPFVVGSILCYPWFLIAQNVICNRILNPDGINRHCNTFSAIRNIYKEAGLRGFYRGFLPGMLWMTVMNRREIYDSYFDPGSLIREALSDAGDEEDTDDENE